MSRIIAYVVLIAISVWVFLVSEPGSVANTISGGLFLGFAVPLVDTALAERRSVRMAWYSLRWFRSQVRVSVSYLFRIEVDDSYVLVRSRQWGHFGPVGGVYKHAPNAMTQFNALRDNLVAVDPVTSGDLRIRLSGKRLFQFAKWFESGRNRETGTWREFYEELVATSIVSGANFPYIEADFLGRTYSEVRLSAYAQMPEQFIYDVYEIRLTQPQLTEFRSLRASGGHPDIRFATEIDIRRRGFQPGAPAGDAIGENAEWILAGS